MSIDVKYKSMFGSIENAKNFTHKTSSFYLQVLRNTETPIIAKPFDSHKVYIPNQTL